MAKTKTLSVLDRKLLDAAASGATPAEMEEMFYVPAATAATRVKELLASTNVWDEIEQRQLRVHQLQSLYRQIQDFGFDPGDPKMTQALTNLIGLIDKISTNDQKINEEQLRIVTETHAKALLQLIEMAYSRARALLAEEYPVVDLGRVDDVFHQGLREASKQIES